MAKASKRRAVRATKAATGEGADASGRAPHPCSRLRPAPSRPAASRPLQRILDAAESLIEEKSLADASIPEIVRRARSSVGGFYSRFKDKDEMLRALEERFFARLASRVDAVADPERWRGATLEQAVAGCVAELVAVRRESPNMIAAFLSRTAHSPEALEYGLRFRRSVEQRVRRLLSAYADEIRHPEPAVALDLCVQIAFGLVLQSVMMGGTYAGDRTLGEAALARELERAVLGYLRTAP